jgi:hypothetical protein
MNSFIVASGEQVTVPVNISYSTPTGREISRNCVKDPKKKKEEMRKLHIDHNVFEVYR